LTSIPPRWTILDLDQIPIPGGFKIVVTTDVPCHLYMVWTTINPRYHPKTEISRGLPVMGDVRICFVVPHQNEQQEAGETLIHTFIKINWPVCQTRYFYFKGVKDDLEPPSNTPIFEKHHAAPILEQVFYEQWHYYPPEAPVMYPCYMEKWY